MFAQLLERSGFRIHGKRADCPFCEGGSKLTVSFSEEKGVAFCHRCHWSTNARRLAREQGVSIPTQKPSKARIRKEQFQKWLNRQREEMADQERRLARRAQWARAALHFYPDHEGAWDAIASWYHEQRKFESFWEPVSDKTGRFALHKAWRKVNA